MFQRKNETREDYENRIKRTADILFPNTPDKKKGQEIRPKNLPLGKSIYDDDVQEDYKNIIEKAKKGKSELDALTDKKYNNHSSGKYKSRKERTSDEQEEFLNEFYPSMRYLGKDKVNQTEDEKIENNKKGNFTKGATDISDNKGKNQNEISLKNNTYNRIENKEKNKFLGDMIGSEASKFSGDIAGVKKGQQKSLDDVYKNVNHDYQPYGNLNSRTNCQTTVITTDLQSKGYDVKASIPYSSEIKDKISSRPNIAYIDPKTGKIPEFIVSKVTNQVECEKWLNDSIKQGERHIFGFQWKQKSSDGKTTEHIVIATKDKNNKLVIYDPQNGHKYENAGDLLDQVQYNFSWSEEKCPPKLLRVDDKEPNTKILNQILKPNKN